MKKQLFVSLFGMFAMSAFAIIGCAKSENTQSSDTTAYSQTATTPPPATTQPEATPVPDTTATAPSTQPAGSLGMPNVPPPTEATAASTKHGDTVIMADGLKYIDLKKGKGASAQSSSTITVYYTGKLTNGTTFDSNVGKQPMTTPLTQLIKGWQEGITGMKVGGKRRLIIPSDMGYGPNGMPPTIPPNATLIFDVELLKVQ